MFWFSPIVMKRVIELQFPEWTMELMKESHFSPEASPHIHEDEAIPANSTALPEQHSFTGTLNKIQ